LGRRVITGNPFLEENFRIITPEVFEFVFHNELKRAVRSQNFLTFVRIEPGPETRDPKNAMRAVARLVSREIRETDLLAETADGPLSLVLLEADLAAAQRALERLVRRLERYDFASPVTLDIGAACCPQDGCDAEELRRVAAQKSGMLRCRSGGPDAHASSPAPDPDDHG
jgi:hypothetical protein